MKGHDVNPPQAGTPALDGAPSNELPAARLVVAALARRYLIRAGATLLIAGGVAAGVCYALLDWTNGTLLAVGAAMVIALGMGYVSFVASCRGLIATTTGAAPVMGYLLGGMLVCALLLVAGALIAGFALGAEWGERIVVLSALFYVLLMVVKIATLHRSIRRVRAPGATIHRGKP